MLEKTKDAITKLLSGTKDQAQIDIFAAVLKDVEEAQSEHKKVSDERDQIQKKYVDTILHFPATDEDPSGQDKPKSLEECMNAEIAKRK